MTVPFFVVEATGLEPATPCSLSTYATDCATPRFMPVKYNPKKKPLSIKPIFEGYPFLSVFYQYDIFVTAVKD